MRVAINGFGRIGRMIFRANLENPKIDIVAVNDLGTTEMAAHLLKYDTNYGVLNKDIRGEAGKIIVDGRETKVVSSRNPAELPWKELGIDLVIECTGVFVDRAGASQHLTAGAKRVMISAPAKDKIDRTIVMGVNEEEYNPETDFIVSNASCTTNCLAPVVKVLHDNFGIKRGLMNTIHSYTNDQNLHDNAHRDFRRARAASLNMIPTTTGAAKTVAEVIPSLKGKLDGLAIRVPTAVVSLVDFTCELEKATSREEINAAFKKAAEGDLKGILGYTEAPLVSSDFRGDEHSGIIDAAETQVMDGNFVKVLAWYDNEWGYSVRCLDLAKYMASQD